jgi:hypothetical protein
MLGAVDSSITASEHQLEASCCRRPEPELRQQEPCQPEASQKELALRQALEQAQRLQERYRQELRPSSRMQR